MYIVYLDLDTDALDAQTNHRPHCICCCEEEAGQHQTGLCCCMWQTNDQQGSLSTDTNYDEAPFFVKFCKIGHLVSYQIAGIGGIHGRSLN